MLKSNYHLNLPLDRRFCPDKLAADRTADSVPLGVHEQHVRLLLLLLLLLLLRVEGGGMRNSLICVISGGRLLWLLNRAAVVMVDAVGGVGYGGGGGGCRRLKGVEDELLVRDGGEGGEGGEGCQGGSGGHWTGRFFQSQDVPFLKYKMNACIYIIISYGALSPCRFCVE
jgi:hypothetical protein